AVAVSDPLAAACSRRYTATYHGPRRTLQDIRLIVLHSTEGRTAESAARYFASPERTGSAHFVIDADYCFRTLAPTWVAWAAPGANHDGLHIEQAGFAHWTREQWLAAGVAHRRAAARRQRTRSDHARAGDARVPGPAPRPLGPWPVVPARSAAPPGPL